MVLNLPDRQREGGCWWGGGGGQRKMCDFKSEKIRCQPLALYLKFIETLWCKKTRYFHGNLIGLACIFSPSLEFSCLYQHNMISMLLFVQLN